ncbi:MAG: D-alanyl-D-alanine carboxypeptidase family protein [Bacillota bacterium]
MNQSKRKGPAVVMPALFTIFITVLILHSTVSAETEYEDGISALAAVLMDQKSGRVLWERNPHRSLPIASITKIMTAILALELGHMEDVIVVSKEAADTEGSSIWLEEGEKKTLEELLYGLILISGNDAAVAIAEHLAGSVEEFAMLMNEKAREIGAVNSHFTNPHGLPDDEHFSTAYDMALIACYALNNERFREIAATEEHTISWPDHPWDRIMSNQNRLLEKYPGGDGVKTGWTQKAGRCFVGSATRNDWQLVVVVLNAPQMWEDATALLDYGFNSYRQEKLLYRGQVVSTAEVTKGEERVNVVVAESFCYPLRPGEKAVILYRINLVEELSAPLPAGYSLGEMEMFLDDAVIGRVELQAGQAVKRHPVSKYWVLLWATFWE